MTAVFIERRRSDSPSSKDMVEKRGVEVADDSGSSWDIWDKAVVEQDLLLQTLHSQQDALRNEVAAHVSDAKSLPSPDVSESSPAQSINMPANKKLTPQIENALAIVEQHHDRVGTTIRSLWGNKECTHYITQLILDGCEASGHIRIGFHQGAMDAMMKLSDLHDQHFGVLGNDQMGPH